MTLLLTPLLPQVLMPGVTGSEIEDQGQPIELHAGDAVMVAAAGEKRRRDFALDCQAGIFWRGRRPANCGVFLPCAEAWC